MRLAEMCARPAALRPVLSVFVSDTLLHFVKAMRATGAGCVPPGTYSHGFVSLSDRLTSAQTGREMEQRVRAVVNIMEKDQR